MRAPKKPQKENPHHSKCPVQGKAPEPGSVSCRTTRQSARAVEKPRTTPQERAEKGERNLSTQGIERSAAHQARKKRMTNPKEPTGLNSPIDEGELLTELAAKEQKSSLPLSEVIYQYATINVRTLKIQNDGYKRHEEDGSCALAEVWATFMTVLGCGIFAVQECRIPGQTTTTCGEYRVFYSGRTTDKKRQHGVGIFIRKDWIKGAVDIQPITERILWIHGTFHGVTRTIMVVYAPTECADESTKEDFYLSMASEMNVIRQRYGDNIIVMGDFNARVGTKVGFEQTDEEFLGQFGMHDDARNNVNGALLREFCATNAFKIADTFFEAENDDYGTWHHSTGPEYIAALDHVLVHDSTWIKIHYCGVRHTDYALPPTDHRVVYLDVMMGPPMGGTRPLKPPRIPMSEAQKIRKDRARMNKRILENSNNKDVDKENQQLGALIAIEVARLMDAYTAQMPMNLDPREELDQLMAILTLSLDNARCQLWPHGVPFTKTPRPGSWIDGEPITKILITDRHKAYMRLQAAKRDPAATPDSIRAAEKASKAADRKVLRQLRRTREKHFIRLANRIQTAHDALNYKLYYKN